MYTAPELEHYEAAPADVYSFGLVVLAAFALRPPWTAEDVVALYRDLSGFTLSPAKGAVVRLVPR